MKKSLVLALFVCGMTSIFAQTVSESSVESTTNGSEKEGIEVEGSLLFSNLEDEADDDLDANGFKIRVGKRIKIASQGEFVPGLISSFSSGEDDGSNQDFKFRDIGIAPRFSFLFESSGIQIRPFIEGGLSIGEMIIEGSGVEVDVNYTRLSASLGVQFELENGLIPFVQYEISEFETSDTADAVASNGQTFNNFPIESIDLSSRSIVLGVGYLF